jgi:hypothetical protein
MAFSRLDVNLRQLGISDHEFPRKSRKEFRLLRSRAAAQDSAREETGVSDGVALQAALSHLACHSNEVSNLYGRHRFHGE